MKQPLLTCLFNQSISILLFLSVLLGTEIKAQDLDHWETVVYNSDTWHFRAGNSEPPVDWMQSNFDDSSWGTAPGGFGYGDGDDNTLTSNLNSIYIRRQFELQDTSLINYLVLHADYDDAFIAYLNGVEIARSENIGTVGVPAPYNATLTVDHEASLYLGALPEVDLLQGAEMEDVIQEGNNTLAIHIRNVDSSSSDMSSNFFLSVGISNSSFTYGPTPSWFVSPIFLPPSAASPLPLIVITTTDTDEIYDEPRVPAHMGIIYNGPGVENNYTDPYNHYDGNINIEIRGASSQIFPKKNYGFETQLEDGSNNNVSLFGMPEENDWVLHGPYTDKSLLRNMLAYHMGAATGKYTPRTQLCELTVNGDYRGVYMFTERIKRDKNRVDMATLRPEDIAGDELTGGYLFQIDRDNLDQEDEGWESSYPDFKFFAYDDPDYDELLQVQKNYIKDYMDDFEGDMNSFDYAAKYLNYVDVDSWVDYFLITEVGKHIDAFKLSFYMHKKKDSNGGKLHFGPLWDFNLAFGNFDFVCSPDPFGWAYLFRGTCDSWHPFWIARLAEIPNVSNQMDCRWTELRAGALHTDSLLQFIDDKVLLLEDAQERNFNRWPVLDTYVWPNDFVGQTYADEVNFLKNWLTQRLQWMDNNMLGNCNEFVSEVTETIAITSKVVLFPNPVDDFVTVNVYDSDFEKVRMEVYDLIGNTMSTHKISQPEERIKLGHLTSGFYIYRILDKEEVIAKGKIAKE